ncbi:hypothetical protein GG344DRAFT_45777, partial [Lentinula edodes]
KYSVFAQSLNPCGHTVCAPCANKWLYRGRTKTCPICRSLTNVAQPVIANLTVDNFVERYIQIRAIHGDSQWQNNGTKLIQWLEKTRYVSLNISLF